MRNRCIVAGFELESGLGELLRIASDLIGVKCPDLVHVGFYVPAGVQLVTQSAPFARVVQIAENDRNIGAPGDMIEA